MTSKTLLRLGAAFLLLAGGLWIWRAVERKSERERTLFPRALSASRVEIESPAGLARLERSDASWRLASPFAFAADAAAVERLLKGLAEARLSEPLSESPERHALFDLTSSSAATLRLFEGSGSPALELLIGRSGADADSVFVREKSSPVVREARGIPREAILQEPGRWADKLLCAVDASQLLELSFVFPKARFTLERRSGAWALKGAASPLSPDWASGPLQEVLTALTRLEADDLVLEKGLDPLVLKGVKAPELRLSLRWRAPGQDPAVPDQSAEFAFGPQGPEFRHAVGKKGVEGFVYLAAPWRLRALLSLRAPGMVRLAK